MVPPAGKSFARDLLCGFVKVAATGVITQAAPEPQHLVLGGSRKRLDGGILPEKPPVVRDHGGDLGLLQHDFGKPYPVRIARSLPGQPVAAVQPLPGDELLREGHAVTFSQIMLAFILRRLAQAVLVMLTVGLIAFSLFRFVGDPVMFMLGQDATPEQRAEITRMLGLDRPFYVQYLRFLANALQGEFGLSLRQVQPVSRLIVDRLPATLELSFVAALFALACGIPMGVYTALKRNTWLAHVMLAVSLAGVSLPTFLIGILLILVFSVQLGWMPSFGRGETVAIGWWTTGLLTASGLKALVLPAITLGLFQMTLIQRLVRSEMLEVLRTDYIRFARARGLTDRAVHFGHALKNTLVPVITITGLQLGAIIAFAIITETVFQWPGMGLLFIQAVSFADVPVMAAYLCLIALFFVVINLVVDLLYYAVDPRLRLRPT
jgi:peptide/nickel transport system permease protein